MKKCSNCGIDKPFSQYYKRLEPKKDGSINYRGECRTCRNIKTKIYRHKDINITNIRYCNNKISAKRRGYSFLLTIEEYNKLTRNQYCYCCNKKFNYTGLDRINNNRGYEIGNVLPCCKYCNAGKNNDTLFNHWTRCKNTYNNLKHLFT